jgi:cation diffusion facilitator CzcD-associated flavoprotein CzcO
MWRSFARIARLKLRSRHRSSATRGQIELANWIELSMTTTDSNHDEAEARATASEVLDALVIGAGFSGLYQLHRLRDHLGLKVQVVEAAPAIGGTWYWNRYPGARCDSLSHSYRFMFCEELANGWESSERYPGPEENCRYLTYVADQLQLHDNIRFNTRVEWAQYDDLAGLWHIGTDAGDAYKARYFITAVGCLSSTNVPDIPGLDRFEGEWYHTGAWPHAGVDFHGKRVGQIGTGSSGIQAAPVVAETAKHLTVFQRTANYSVPAHNGPLSDVFQKHVCENFAQIRETMRTSPNGMPFPLSERLAVETDADEREAIYEQAWQVGGLQFRSAFFDLMVDEQANVSAAQFIKNKIRATVENPDVAQKLTDINHPYGTKRPPVDSFYFETYNLPHVDLVDLRATPIEEITEHGIRTSEQEYPLDIIIFATGFDAMTGALLKIDIRGREGKTLAQTWLAGPTNYLGLQIAGFPNMFTITGPGSPSVLSNMPVAIEQHVDWVTDCIEYLERNQIASIEASETAMHAWVEHVNEVANATLMPKANHSWYHGANVPGKPIVFMPYAGGLPRFRAACNDIAQNGYKGFVLQQRT